MFQPIWLTVDFMREIHVGILAFYFLHRKAKGKEMNPRVYSGDFILICLWISSIDN